MTDWQDRLAGHRMQVDRTFASKVRESGLTKQEWSLVMTAVEFDIEGEGDQAELVADTSKVETVVPEFDNLGQADPGGMAGGNTSSKDLIDSVKSALGVDTGVDEEKLAEATRLANEYVSELQDHLQEQGRWEAIRETASHPSQE